MDALHVPGRAPQPGPGQRRGRAAPDPPRAPAALPLEGAGRAPDRLLPRDRGAGGRGPGEPARPAVGGLLAPHHRDGPDPARAPRDGIAPPDDDDVRADGADALGRLGRAPRVTWSERDARRPPRSLGRFA